MPSPSMQGNVTDWFVALLIVAPLVGYGYIKWRIRSGARKADERNSGGTRN